MTGLLVSVRDVAEAASALRGGADLIDVKEPSHGALGAAEVDVVSAVCNFVDGRVPVSVACGELLDEEAYPFRQLPDLSFAKIGLAGCSREPAWEERLAAAWQQFSPTVRRVAVAYADWLQCDSLSPDVVIKVAAQHACGYMLLDTTDKTKGLLGHVAPSQIEGWVALAKSYGMQFVIAGSVTLGQLDLIVQSWRPSYVAVRGAACVADRESGISYSRVAELRQKLRELTPRESESC